MRRMGGYTAFIRFSVVLPVVAGLVGLLALSVAPVSVLADEASEREEAYHRDFIYGVPNNPTDEWLLATGGRMYDKWWEALETAEPKETHAAYPADGKQKGSTTWRCKECHGWDYKGAAGAYKKGSHFSGIKGIDGKAGADPAQIAAMLRGKPHGFTAEMIPDEALMRLAAFVSRGQHDTNAYIDSETKAVKGNAERGRVMFQAVCAACHGFDGKSLNFGSEEKPEFVGTVAADNPWEGLHKLVNGQPGQPMPVMRGFSLEQAVDILAYAQSLPVK